MLFNLDFKCAVMHFGFNDIGKSMELCGKYPSHCMRHKYFST